MAEHGLPDFSREPCPICADPSEATWEQRVEHGCAHPDEYIRCMWCGEARQQKIDNPRPSAFWCGEKCVEAHRKANPKCWWFDGWLSMSDTLPGGSLDGIWEDSGLMLGDA